MKYYLIAGEASGDLHGSNLVKKLVTFDSNARLRGWGGDLMKAAGAEIVMHYKDLAFMGFIEVLKNIRTIYKNFEFCKKDILAFHPDAILLIDYPGFNLRIASWAKKNNYNIYYYISPQLWAWDVSRVKIIKKSVDLLFVILPFEKTFYANHGLTVEYVGHPLLESLIQFIPDVEIQNKFSGKKILALLPGSRRQEIERILPVMLLASQAFPEYSIIIAGAPSQETSFYQEIIARQNLSSIPSIISNKTYSILSIAKLAWVGSGTATLETALFRVPQIVCYAGNPLSYWIAKRLVKVKYISLVNLILDKALLVELIQKELTPANLIDNTKELESDEGLKNITNGYSELQFKLLPDKASSIVAKRIIAELENVTQDEKNNDIQKMD